MSISASATPPRASGDAISLKATSKRTLTTPLDRPSSDTNQLLRPQNGCRLAPVSSPAEYERKYSWSAKPIQLLAWAFLALVLSDIQSHAEEVRVSEAAKALHDLFASEWDYQMEQHPTWASSLGDRRWNDRWGDRSIDAINRRHAHYFDALDKLKTIDREALSPADRLNYELFLKDYKDEVEGHQYRWYLMPINHSEGIQPADELA